jgi:hypothetical protein
MVEGQEKTAEQIKAEREKILIRARKLKALADRGIDGEKTSAREILNRFMLKHGLKEREVESAKNYRVFSIQYEDDVLILSNVILSINPATKLECTELYVKCELDEEDFKEAVEKYKVFIKLWRKHKEWSIMCFMTKHDKHFKMDEYAYQKFTRSNQQKNPDIVKAEAIDSEMRDVAEGSRSRFEDREQIRDKEISIMAMNKILPFMPTGNYKRKFGGN